MAQLTIYLPDEIERQARKAAKSQGVSLSRWIAGQVGAKVRTSWPAEVLAAIGRFPDFPEAADLREGYGADGRREPLA